MSLTIDRVVQALKAGSGVLDINRGYIRAVLLDRGSDLKRSFGFRLREKQKAGTTIMVSHIELGGLAATCGCLFEGDGLLEVNLTDVSAAEMAEVTQIIKNTQSQCVARARGPLWHALALCEPQRPIPHAQGIAEGAIAHCHDSGLGIVA